MLELFSLHTSMYNFMHGPEIQLRRVYGRTE
jgi:hypothetical protein